MYTNLIVMGYSRTVGNLYWGGDKNGLPSVHQIQAKAEKMNLADATARMNAMRECYPEVTWSLRVV